jgi:hypothetical protein
MFLEEDFIQKEVDPPHNHWCASGHEAPPFFKRQGPDNPEEPTKFFEVSGHGIHGIYCELCLIVAHHMAKCKKQGLIK